MSHLAPIYAAWDGNAEAMASDIGQEGVTVRQWRNRKNIPPQYWQAIIDAAAKHNRTLAWTDFLKPDAAEPQSAEAA